MNKPVPIRTAAQALGVSTSTLRRWDITGKLKPSRTIGGQRRYDLDELRHAVPHGTPETRTSIAYARVASPDQQTDLTRQKQVLEFYCARQGWTVEIIADLGSGINHHKKGLQKLLDDILAGKVGRLVLTHKDRLLHFGADLVFAICQAKDVEVVIINQGEESTFEDEFASDVLEMISVLSGRLETGHTRSHKQKKLIDAVRLAVKEAR